MVVVGNTSWNASGSRSVRSWSILDGGAAEAVGVAEGDAAGEGGGVDCAAAGDSAAFASPVRPASEPEPPVPPMANRATPAARRAAAPPPTSASLRLVRPLLLDAPWSAWPGRCAGAAPGA